MLRISALICCLPAAIAQAPDERLEVLTKIRAKVLDAVCRMPKYMCTQTIDRTRSVPVSRKEPPPCFKLRQLRQDGQWKLRPSTSDRLRLDVGALDDKEMYSWSGENRFEDRGLLEMIRHGAISTGSFTLFLKLVFETDVRPRLFQADQFSLDRTWRAASTYFYLGERTENGRELVEYGFSVPVEESHYRFRDPRDQLVTTAYNGTLLADRQTLDLVRVVVRASELPEETANCEATTTLDYQQVRINEDRFLLPVTMRFQVMDYEGSEADNRTVNSGCHQFLGESTISFDAAPDNAPAAKPDPVPQIFEIPPWVAFSVVSTQDIDTAKAAAGDPVTARLATAIHDRSPGHEIRAGAVVKGRIIRLEHRFDLHVSIRNQEVAGWKLVIGLESIESDGQIIPLHAVADHPIPPTASRGPLAPRGVALGALADMGDREYAIVWEFTPKNHVFKRGLTTQWVTQTPRPPSR